MKTYLVLALLAFTVSSAFARNPFFTFKESATQKADASVADSKSVCDDAKAMAEVKALTSCLAYFPHCQIVVSALVSRKSTKNWLSDSIASHKCKFEAIARAVYAGE